MQDRVELNLLIDYYGAFLTENQRELIGLYCDDDLSLSEIAEQRGISRQGVRDVIARSGRILSEMEDKLRLIERDRKVLELSGSIINELDAISVSDPLIKASLASIRAQLSELSDIMEGKDGI